MYYSIIRCLIIQAYMYVVTIHFTLFKINPINSLHHVAMLPLRLTRLRSYTIAGLEQWNGETFQKFNIKVFYEANVLQCSHR